MNLKETEKKKTEKLEGIANQRTEKTKKENKRKTKANESSEANGENKQVTKKVASEGKGKEDYGSLDDDEQDSKGTERGNSVSTGDDEGCSKKVASGDEAKMSLEKIATEGKDKPELSHKKKKKKKKESAEQADSVGMIFMCNSETKKGCYLYKFLGQPANKREMVEKVHKGMKLFLYDVDLKLVYGIHKATGHGGFNIEPKAFKSQFPSQVHFSVVEDCFPLAEEKFGEVIKSNNYTKTMFGCKLTTEQVKNLCKIFTSSSRESRSEESGSQQLKSETSIMAKRGRSMGRHVHKKRKTERARQAKWVEESRYHEYPHLHGTDSVTTAAVTLALPQYLLPPTGQSYNRTSETGVYGRDTMTES